jgi:hypothetical protein
LSPSEYTNFAVPSDPTRDQQPLWRAHPVARDLLRIQLVAAGISVVALVSFGVAFQFFAGMRSGDPSSVANHARAPLYLIWAVVDAGFAAATLVALLKERRSTILKVEGALIVANIVEIFLGNVVTTLGVVLGLILPLAVIAWTLADERTNLASATKRRSSS